MILGSNTVNDVLSAAISPVIWKLLSKIENVSFGNMDKDGSMLTDGREVVERWM